MAHDELTHTGQSSLENVEDVQYAYLDYDEGTVVSNSLSHSIGSALFSDDWNKGFGEAMFSAMLTYFGGQAANLNEEQLREKLENLKGLTWDEFFDEVFTGKDKTTIEEAFIRAYRWLALTDPGADNVEDVVVGTLPTNGGDWQILLDKGLITSTDDFKDQFVTAFNHFLEGFPSPEFANYIPFPANEINAVEVFLRDFVNFFTSAVTIEKDTNPVSIKIGKGPFDPIEQRDLRLSFEELYETRFPGGDRAQFEDFVGAFYEQQVAKNGYFIPTQDIDDWIVFLESKRLTAEDTTLASIGAEKVLILDRIFKLVAAMIEILQQIAAVQADRLNFFTSFQKAYTERLEKLQVFIADDPDLSDKINNPNENKQSDARADLNTQNTNYKERMTARRQVLSDDAKALQSNINQSNDAVSQQANLATAILQQLSTILGALFR